MLRLVHSGFGADASFDDEFESTYGGWTTFLKMLQHSLERRPGAPAQTVAFSRRSGVCPAEAWKRIAATGELDQGIAVPGHPPGYGGFVGPALNDSYLAVFCEGEGSALVTSTACLAAKSSGFARTGGRSSIVSSPRPPHLRSRRVFPHR